MRKASRRRGSRGRKRRKKDGGARGEHEEE